MKICVVGGTGNISTSIVNRLVQQGHDVTCFNRGKSAVPAGARLIQGDRNDRAEFEKAMQAEHFDAAIDMICFNAGEALSSLRAFSDVGHFVQCSTVCTYGVDYDWLPVTEDHLLRPITDYGRNKVKADAIFMQAYYETGFPVTIIKPSTTYGPAMGLLRQIAWEFSWIDRIRQGRPIIVCGDGLAASQWLHVDDAALCFAGVLGKPACLGQTYNMMNRGFKSWADYHRTAMKVLGREVDLVGVPLDALIRAEVPSVEICRDIFAYNCVYSPNKLFRDVPEFQPRVTLEQGMHMVLEAMDREGRVPAAEPDGWEDKLIQAQQAVGRPRE